MREQFFVWLAIAMIGVACWGCWHDGYDAGHKAAREECAAALTATE